MSCALCSARNQSYRLVYADDLVMVVVNFEPVKPGHVMVMPIRHVENLGDLEPEEAAQYLRTIDRCMAAMTKLSNEPPMCLVNGWAHRTQSHLHVHVLPSKHDMRGLYVAAEGVAERVRVDQETLTRMANDIRAVFE